MCRKTVKSGGLIWSCCPRNPHQKAGNEDRPGSTGVHSGAVPPQLTACAPQTKIVPPKRRLCPEEINRLGASVAQIEVQISVFCGLTPDFVTFLG